MPIAKLTHLTLQNLKPGLHYDARTPGFGIRVGARRRTFFVVRGSARVQTTIGYDPVLSLAEARKRALVALGSPLELKTEAKDMFLALDRWRLGSKRVLTSNLNHFPWRGQLSKISH